MIRKIVAIFLGLLIGFSLFAKIPAHQFKSSEKSPAIKEPLASEPQIHKKASQRKSDFYSYPSFQPVLFDSSNNGYGWYSSAIDPLDCCSDWLLAVYRKFNEATTGEIAAAIWKIPGLDLDSMIIIGNINCDPLAQNGRYPNAVATSKRPYVFWTEYLGEGTTKICMATSDDGWDDVEWIIPSLLLDNFWLVSVDVVEKDDITHIGMIALEEWLKTGEYVFIHITLPESGWDTTQITSYEVNSPHFTYGKDGFGVWVTTGHDASFDDFRIMFSYTTDYGATWSDIKFISLKDIGIPPEIPGVIAGGFTWSHDAQVNEFDNSIHFVTTIIWGEEIGGGYYVPNPQYEAIYDIHSEDAGTTWTASRLAHLNGFAEDDEAGKIECLNMVQISFDSLGNLYVAWMDRPSTGLVESPYNMTIGEPYYYQDIFASTSNDGGFTWSSALNVVETPDIPECGMHLSRHSLPGITYIGYTVPAPERIYNSPPSMWADHFQWNYMIEVDSFPSDTLTMPDPHFAFHKTDSFYCIVLDSAFIIDTTIKDTSIELERDDAIGVFTSDGFCVGAANYYGFTAINAWRDDPNTPEIDGYTIGDSMYFKIWDTSDGIEYDATPYYTVGDGTFGDSTYTRLSLSSIKVGVEEISQLPNSFNLSQNYPNPFNQLTLISYQPPRHTEGGQIVKSKVSLKIYDVTGKLVKTLVNENKRPGYYTIRWDAKELPSGIYFIRLCAKGTSASGGDTKNYTATKKLILLK
ncbi:T9SS type A sorting domain-containing protein [candidate division WOR-3 bacterium]|nr:T9SS type A sorting domain-containing protein [candidate division WOR-3 bacterium]